MPGGQFLSGFLEVFPVDLIENVSFKNMNGEMLTSLHPALMGRKTTVKYLQWFHDSMQCDLNLWSVKNVAVQEFSIHEFKV